jgi:hypothetical protein
MQKLTVISSGQNNRSCSVIHHESNKIRFAFFRCFYDFLRNLQESANSLYYFSALLQGGPRKELQIRNVVPGQTGRRGSPELSHSGGGFGRGMGGEGRGGH